MSPADAFQRNEWPTLGVEIELQLIDSTTQALRSAIFDILPYLPEPLADSVKPEFMQCYVEINTDVCRTVTDVGLDLLRTLRVVEQVAARERVSLFWGGTHPFSHWQDQEITPNERYFRLADLLQETVIRPVTFGLHVHVGVESGDKAIQISDRIQRDLPTLLALSANSPFWHGRSTGHHAHRIEVLEGLPTGGLPPLMNSWADYQNLVQQLQTAGFIESPRELWWDVRPNAANGTLEVRICDMPSQLMGVLGLTALIQCLVQKISTEIDEGIEEPQYHPSLVRQNRWRACRFGLEADLVDLSTLKPISARATVENLVDRLRGVSETLGCAQHLESVLEMIARPSGAERQLAEYQQTGSLTEVVRVLAGESRIGDGFNLDWLFPSRPHRDRFDEARLRSPIAPGAPVA